MKKKNETKINQPNIQIIIEKQSEMTKEERNKNR